MRSSRFSLESLEDRLALSAVPPVVNDLSNDKPITIGPVGAQRTVADSVPLATLKDQFGLTGKGYTVAVLDSGLDYRHAAFGGKFGVGTRIVAGYDFVDGRFGGYVEGDTTAGPDSNPLDYNGHGTNVAGIIGANDGDFGGIAPEANIIPLRVLDKNNQGSLSWVASALQWVITNRAKYNIVAVNMSLGSGSYTGTPNIPSIETKLESLVNSGVFIAASSGNDYFTSQDTQGIKYPAISENVVSVGAVFDGSYAGTQNWSSGAVDYAAAKDRIISFTQRGPALNLLAPGAKIASTFLTSSSTLPYATYAGTSQAAAFVSGAAVLLRQAIDKVGKSSLANQASMLQIFQSTGVSVKDGDNEVDNVKNTGLTFKRIDILGAVASVGRVQTTLAVDPGESNNTIATAKSAGTIGTSSTISYANWHNASDVDWFRFSVAADGIYRLQLKIPNPAAVGQLSFQDLSTSRERYYLFNTVSGVANIDVSLRKGVNYYVMAKPTSSYIGSYRLNFSLLTPNASAGGTDAPPPPDAREANDTQATAKSLGKVSTQTFTGLTLHKTTDVDWYQFQTTVGGLRRIEVATTNRNTPAKFTFYDFTKGKERTISSWIVDGIALLDIDMRSGVNYFIKVEALNQPARYTLKFVPTVEAQGVFTGASINHLDLAFERAAALWASTEKRRG